MKLISDDTNKDAIIAFLKNPEGDVALTDKQKSLLRWYTDAYVMLRNYTSIPDTIRVLIKFSKQVGEPISESTARRYVYDCQDVYGYASKVKPEAIRHQALEIINDAVAMARNQNDPKTMIMGADKMVAIGGVESDQPFNPEMLQQHVIEVNLDNKGLKVVNAIAARGVVDLDALMGNVMNSMAVDAEIIPDGNS